METDYKRELLELLEYVENKVVLRQLVMFLHKLGY